MFPKILKCFSSEDGPAYEIGTIYFGNGGEPTSFAATVNAMEQNICKLPPGAWDSHVHIVDTRYPFDPERVYTPRSAPYDELMIWENHIGVRHVCIIAMAAYGMDNSSMLAALEKLDGKGRGVVVIDPDTVTDEDLDKMHAIGVRGIRVNFHTRKEKISREAFQTLVQKYANRIRRLNWVIQLWIELYQFALVADVIPQLGVDVVIDHLGGPHSTTTRIQEQDGYKEIMKLLREKKMHVKLSGIYRFKGEEMPGLDEYVTEILQCAPDQVVWGSDRPHPAGPERNPDGDPYKAQEYLEIDIPAFIERCRAWAGHDEHLIKKIFVDNPRRLWRYDYDD